MELNAFIKNFASQFEDTESSEFTSSTIFKDLEEWDSLMTLTIIGMINEDYDVRVNGEDLKSVKTIEELYNIIISRNEQ